MNFKNLIKKYFNRNKDICSTDNIVHEMNGSVLYETETAFFDFKGLLIKEITKYCEEQGFNINKIVFISSYDLEIKDNLSLDLNLKMLGESKISIIKENNKLIARLFIREIVDIKRV